MDENQDSNNAKNTTSQKGSMSFISSLFGRSVSISEGTDQNEFVGRRRRTRGFSESSLDEFEVGSQAGRNRSMTVNDMEENSLNADNSARKKSLSISAMLLGTNQMRNNYSELTSVDSSKDTMDGATSSTILNNPNQEKFHNGSPSQTDHLNQRLLGSFLTRINSMAANLVDPTGKGENPNGQVYTDDPMMDRILKRVESSNTDSHI